MTVHIAIVDDEPLAREGMRALVELDPDLEIVAVCANGREAIRALQTTTTDILLLDVQMPKLSGFDVLEAVGVAHAPAVVFVTAYDSYAIRAFDANAVDYVVKPYRDARFTQALQRAKRAVDRRDLERSRDALARVIGAVKANSNSSRQPNAYATRVVVKSAGVAWYIPVDEIEWIEGADYYARVHAEGRRLLTRESLQRFVQTLDPSRFARVHRSAIVNVERVRAVRTDRTDRMWVVLQGDSQVPLSRSYRSALEALLAQRS
jgi:two-component system, LytTR family, response regulator